MANNKQIYEVGTILTQLITWSWNDVWYRSLKKMQLLLVVFP